MIYITVEPVLVSRLPNGRTLATLELEYPRFIHAEFMTHRVFSRNAQSSRAVPAPKLSELPCVTPFMWGKNQAGMQSAEELRGWRMWAAGLVWQFGNLTARLTTRTLAKIGLHKQWANRPIEPYTTIKVIVTSTEWDNFFNLRDHPAAQPEIRFLAQQIKFALDLAAVQTLEPGDWHVPYVKKYKLSDGSQYFLSSVPSELSLQEALQISTSCCAQVSFRKLDRSLAKAKDIWEKLGLYSAVPHASPTEHQAQALSAHAITEHEDLTSKFPHLHLQHVTPVGYWSGNLCGAIQHRHNLLGATKL